MAPARSKWIADRRLNSLTALAPPIYQHAHGPRTVRHLGLKIKALSTPVCCRRTGQDREHGLRELAGCPASFCTVIF